MTKTEIKNLNERVEKLSEVKANRRSAAFVACWNSLTETERQLARETLHEFGALQESGQMNTEADCQKWYDNLPLEKRTAFDKLPHLEDAG